MVYCTVRFAVGSVSRHFGHTMRLLQNAYKVSVQDRKILAVLMVAFVLTNSHVSSVQAAGIDPVVSADMPTKAVVVTTLPVSSDTAIVQAPTSTPAEQPAAQPKREPTLRTAMTTVTAYSSAPNQTDGTPFVTADGSCVNDGVIAANFLKIGTRVRLPDLFGDKIFEVHDRMNERYFNRIDVWMKDIKDARQFGLKRTVRVEVVAEGDNQKQWDLGLTNADCQEIALALK